MKFAVVGACGWAGCHHVKALAKVGHEVAVVVDPSPDCARVAAEIGARAYPSVDKADLTSVEAGTVALRPDFQPDAVIGLVRRGLHVFCEKPMSATEPDARRLADLARSAGRIVMPGYLLRFHPHMVAYKRALDGLGRLRRLTCVSNVKKDVVEGWRRTLDGGGVGSINGSHSFDLANWLSGSRLTVRLAEVANVHFDMPAEDSLYASMVSEEGARISIFTEWAPHPPVSSEGILIDGGWQLRVEAETDLGSLVLTRKGFRQGGIEDAVTESFARNPFEIELEHFVDVINGKAKPITTVEDNYRAQQLIDASLRLGARVSDGRPEKASAGRWSAA